MSGPGRDDWASAGGGGCPGGGVDGAGSGLVRPYVVAGGRAKSWYQLQARLWLRLRIMRLVTFRFLVWSAMPFPDSALLRMPWGVARVLVAGMTVDGLVRVHQLDNAHGRPDLNLLERVLSGLRKL
jgi:Protein of unknown function (DUF742)